MNEHLSFGQFFARVVLVIVAVAVVLFLWQVVDVLLFAFAGALLAVFLHTLVQLLNRLLPLPEKAIFALVLVLLLLVVGLVGWFIAPQLSRDFIQIFTDVPAALEQLGSQLVQYGWAQELQEHIPSITQMLPSGSSLFSRITGTFSTTFNVLTNVVYVIFIGIFLAVNPRLYRSGLLQLVPESRRDRMNDVIDEVVTTLRWWLLGKLFSMVVIGSLTGVALWLLGMPMALALGITAGLLEFIPYVGPVLTGVLAALLAFVQSPMQALYVLLLYIGIQQFESNLLTPLVHRYTVLLPPAITLTAIVALGFTFGFVGLLVGTPLVAVALILVKMLYIEEVLGEVPELPRQILEE